MEENNNLNLNSEDSTTLDIMTVIEELKKLEPSCEEDSELIRKAENLVMSQHKMIERLRSILPGSNNKGIEDISKSISELYGEFKQQLLIAQYVQKALFPKNLPSNGIIEIKADILPMEETSSDFYDVFEILEGRVYGVVMADVSGRGVSAALVTSMVKMLFSNAVSKYLSPSQVIGYVNKELSKTLEESNYLNCFYGVVDLQDKEIIYVTAGNTSNLLYRPLKGTFEKLSTNGQMIGIDSKYDYEEKRIKLEYGDELLIYTDDLSDNSQNDGKRFDLNKFLEIIKNDKHNTTNEKLQLMLDSVRKFRDEVQEVGDAAIIYIRTLKKGAEMLRRDSFKVDESQNLLAYYEKLLKLKEQKLSKEGIIEVLQSMSEVYTALGQYDIAVSNLKDAKDLSYGINDRKTSISIMYKLAHLYVKTGRLDKALEHINRCLKYYEGYNDEISLIKAYTILARIEYMQRRYKHAVRHEGKSLRIAEKYDRKYDMVISYNRIGVIHAMEGNTDKAKAFYEKSARTINLIENSMEKAKLLNKIGILHKGFGVFDKALNSFNEALSILETYEDVLTQAKILRNIGKLYLGSDDEKAMEYFNKCVDVSITNDVPSMESVALVFRAGLYLKQGKVKEPIQDCLRVVTINDKLKVDYLRGRVFIVIAKWLSVASKSEKEENNEIIQQILNILKVPASSEKFFKLAISESKNPIYPETRIPALYEYAVYHLKNNKEEDDAKAMIRSSYYVAVKYGIYQEKKIIEQIKKDHDIEN